MKVVQGWLAIFLFVVILRIACLVRAILLSGCKLFFFWVIELWIMNFQLPRRIFQRISLARKMMFFSLNKKMVSNVSSI